MKPSDAAKRTGLLACILVVLAISCNLPTQNTPQNQAVNNQAGSSIESEPPPPTAPPFPSSTAPISLKPQTPTPSNTATQAPTHTAAPTATIKDHYYFDNFESYPDNPLTDKGQGVLSGFQNGTLMIEVPPNKNHIMVAYNQYLATVSISTDVQFDGGSNASVGLFCRRVVNEDQSSRTYAFMIHKNGSYAFQLWETDENNTTYATQTYDQGTTNLLDTATTPYHRLHIVCLDQTFYFYINGQLISETTIDEPVVSGYTGMITLNPPEAAEKMTSIWEFVAVTNPIGE